MVYNKQIWKDEIPDLTRPIKDVSGKQKTDPQTGRPLYELVQEGTRITSERLNHIEDGIETGHELLEELTVEVDAHVSDVSRHLTSAERVTWNAKETPAGAQQKVDASLASAKSYTDTQLLTKVDKSSIYTKSETDQRIEAVVGAAPDALDTLKEIGDALNNDPNFAATITTQLAGKVDKVSGKQLSTEDYTTTEKTKLAGLTSGAGGSGSATDTVIGNRTLTDSTAPTGDTGTLTTLFSWLANMIKSITGGATWRTVPGMTIAAIKTILDAAVSIATPSTLIKRDASGRAQVVAPSAAGDIALKSTVDAAITTATNAGAALSIPLVQKGVVNGVAALNADGQVLGNGSLYGSNYFEKALNFHFENGVVNQKVDVFITGYMIGVLQVSITGNWENDVAVGKVTKRLSVHAGANVPTPDYQDSSYISVNGSIRNQLSISNIKWSSGVSKWYFTIEARTGAGNSFSVHLEGASVGGLLPTFALGSVYTGAATTLPLAVQVIPDDTATQLGYKVWHAGNDGSLFKIKQQIPNATDYNTLTDLGSWEIFGGSGTNLSPVAYGVLNVSRTVDGYLKQEATSVTAPYATYYRVRNETTWSPLWKRVITDSELSSSALANTVAFRDGSGSFNAVTLGITNPNNASATATLGYLLDIPRIRIGGSGVGSAAPFEIQGPGDIVMSSLTQQSVLTVKQFVSTIPTGTPPMVVGSTTTVANFSAYMLEGLRSSQFAFTGTVAPDANLNTVITAGIYRLQSSAMTNIPGTSYYYGQMLVLHAPGTDTIVQVIYPYTAGGPVYRRGNPTEVGGSGTYSPWYKMWTEENDGAGSTLDADLHDGWHASQAALANTSAVRDANKKLAEVAANRAVTKELQLTTTAATVVSTFSTAAVSMITVKICLRVAVARTVGISVFYVDTQGVTVERVVLPSTAMPVGSWDFIPITIVSGAANTINVVATSTVANSVYVSAVITEEG